jgi:hypothetical protein
MAFLFRLLYLCAAFLSMAAGALVVASLFVQDRIPQSTQMLGIHLAVGAVFLGVGVLLLGIRRHAAGIAALARGRHGQTAQELALRVDRLLAYLVAGGAFMCLILGAMTYGILGRIGQGFAVFD